jgi:hypothetical protein
MTEQQVYRIPISETLTWSTGERTLCEMLADVAADNTPWLQDAERQVEDTGLPAQAGGDFYRDRRLETRVEGGDFVVYLVEDVLTLRVDSLDDRPLCPKCDKPLYAEVEERTTGIVPAWAGENGAYAGFDAGPLDGDGHESDLVRLYCACGWSADPRRVEVCVETEEVADG